MKGLWFCEEVVREGYVKFMINGDTYELSYENQWYQLRKNGGGYKSEFYTLGIKDRHDLADSLVKYVMEA